MNKDDFFEAVKNGVLENLKKTDETLEANLYSLPFFSPSNFYDKLYFILMFSQPLLPHQKMY